MFNLIIFNKEAVAELEILGPIATITKVKIRNHNDIFTFFLKSQV